MKRLPWLLALVPILAYLLGLLSELRPFSFIRSPTDVLNLLLFFPFMLLYDVLGLLHVNFLDNTAHRGRDLVYVASCATTLFLVGLWIRAIALRTRKS